jgi:hypothetical protein
MTNLLKGLGSHVQRQGAEFEWMHVAVEGDLESGIWLYKIFDAALVYAGTGTAAKEEIPFARGLIVRGHPALE